MVKKYRPKQKRYSTRLDRQALRRQYHRRTGEQREQYGEARRDPSRNGPVVVVKPAVK